MRSLKDIIEAAHPGRTHLKVDEVAELMGTAPSTLYPLLRSGDLPAIRLGPRSWRVAVPDLVAWMEHGGVPDRSAGRPILRAKLGGLSEAAAAWAS